MVGICEDQFFTLACQKLRQDCHLILYIVALARATNFPTRPEKVKREPGQSHIQDKTYKEKKNGRIISRRNCETIRWLGHRTKRSIDPRRHSGNRRSAGRRHWS